MGGSDLAAGTEALHEGLPNRVQTRVAIAVKLRNFAQVSPRPTVRADGTLSRHETLRPDAQSLGDWLTADYHPVEMSEPVRRQVDAEETFVSSP